MKQRNDLAPAAIERPNIAPLPCIAACASIGEIVVLRQSAMLPADDVVYLMRKIASSSWSRQYSQRRPVRSATNRRIASPTSLATRRELPRSGFGLDHDVLKLQAIFKL
jgi:hypothetical protein